jgi:beta-glucosidase
MPSRWLENDMPQTGGALNSPDGPEPEHGETLNVAPMQDVFARAASSSLEEASRYGLGHLTRIYGSAPISAVEGAAELVRQQRTVQASSRLGIPGLVHEECLTGFTTYGATVYPAAIAWGATFDPDLIERMAAAIGRDMAALGSASTRGSRRCWMWCVTTAGVGLRRRWARIRTSSRCSAPRTSGGCKPLVFSPL